MKRPSLAKFPLNPNLLTYQQLGTKLYDELGQAMINNPLNPADSWLVAKLAKIGRTWKNIISWSKWHNKKCPADWNKVRWETDRCKNNKYWLCGGCLTLRQEFMEMTIFLEQLLLNWDLVQIYPNNLYPTKENNIMVSTNMLFTSSQDRLHQ